MADKKDTNEKELTLKGCYGEYVSYDGLLGFLEDSFESNRESESEGSDERFATCIWGHSGIGKCVSGDTLVETDRGMIPIRDLFPETATGSSEMEFASPTGLRVLSVKGMKEVSFLYYGGIKKSIRIVTETGRSLTGSEVHPVRSVRPDGEEEVAIPFRRMIDLRLGDFVGIVTGRDENSLWLWNGGSPLRLPGSFVTPRAKGFLTPKYMDEDLAWILGVLVGEGTCTYEHVIRMTQDRNKPLTKKYLDACLKVFGVIPSETPDKRTPATSNFDICRTDLRRWLASIGLGYEESKDKHVPWSILSARRDDWIAFIAGLCEAEASSETSGISISSNSERLLREVQVLLTSLGMTSQLSPKTDVSYRLWITGEDARSLNELIQFSRAKGSWMGAKGNPNNKGIPSKIAREILLRMKESHLSNGGHLTKKAIHSCPLNRIYDRAFLKHSRWSKDVVRRIAGMFDCAGIANCMELELAMSYEYERVISISENGEIPLYDLCVPDGHEFIANGFAVHNTALVKQHCRKPVLWQGKEFPGYTVFDVPIAQFEEMGDLHGMPSRHVKIAQPGDGGPDERWVPEEVVQSWLASGESWQIVPSAGVRTMYAPPDWVPTEPGPSILLLDDWNRASVRIIKGIMQLLQNYGMVSWKLPAGCNIVLTANPDEQDYLVTSIDNAILTRIRSVTLAHDAKEWAVWAQAEKLDPRGINFVLRYPEMMVGAERTNPRTLAQCFRDMRRISDLGSKESVVRFKMMASSLLDEQTVSSLIVFMERDVELIVEPEQILSGKDWPWIQEHVAKLMGGREKRVDVLGVICDRLFAHLVQPGTKPDKVSVSNFQKFVTMEEIPEDLRHNLCLRLSRVKDNGKTHQWILHNDRLTKLIMAVV